MRVPQQPPAELGFRQDGTPVLRVTATVELDADELAILLANHHHGTVDGREELPAFTVEHALATVADAVADCARGFHEFANEPTRYAVAAAGAWAADGIEQVWSELGKVSPLTLLGDHAPAIQVMPFPEVLPLFAERGHSVVIQDGRLRLIPQAPDGSDD
ncbi:hypothetical protein ACFV1L_35970 [Kitasatospora sp. NPDC059646]|uniref:hypothetical protein n=1 Tax=Kitasatospora sp. NPDC059646 TaxID=3346893 RepID=UPI00369B679E